MNEETKRNAIWAVAATLMVLGMWALFAVLCLRISENDHAKIDRDRAVKVACVDHGKSIIGANCVSVTR